MPRRSVRAALLPAASALAAALLWPSGGGRARAPHGRGCFAARADPPPQALASLDDSTGFRGIRTVSPEWDKPGRRGSWEPPQGEEFSLEHVPASERDAVEMIDGAGPLAAWPTVSQALSALPRRPSAAAFDRAMDAALQSGRPEQGVKIYNKMADLGVEKSAIS
ncbi:unnamed protein product [Prorocentrum cordatum]|uniref:Uncharacterized protein n=1 Tax=Prorocentrum cordatum TaxID=2364126 RepID=A0ABN9QCZ7_9DINO|nr:unnamed protein product [Polarella glacialis]